MYELPLFPLNTVLFPGMPLRLHIFEERYQVMMQRVMQTNQTFGVNLIRSGTEALGPLPEPYLIGCTARVIQVEPIGDGRLNLTVVGDERYKILHLGANHPYLTAFVESMPLQEARNPKIAEESQKLRKRLVTYLTLLASNSAPTEIGEMQLDFDISNVQLPDDPLLLIYLAAALLQVPAHEKQPMLEAQSATHLIDMVQRLYRRELAVMPNILAVSEEQARQSAWSN